MRIKMNYWDLREIVKNIIPRRAVLEELEKQSLVKEKGRKVNYQQFNLEKGEMISIQRLLNKEEITSFLEISLRAPHCIVEGQSVQTDRGDKPIEKVVKRNRVASFNEAEGHIEFERVEDTYFSIRDDIFEIETESGKIRVTSDHPVFTKRGWVMAKDLTEEDEILGME
jgi:intein/homing endonuclease